MRSKKKGKFFYQNGRLKFSSDVEKPHHIIMMMFDLVMKWVLRLAAIGAGSMVLGKGVSDLIARFLEHL